MHIAQAMNQILFLRRRIFKVNQAEFARLAGVGQATVSRWENGETSPSLESLRTIRAEATRRSIPWDHEWLFGVLPAEAAEARQTA